MHSPPLANQKTPVPGPTREKYPYAIIVAAHIVSYIFHPLFIPVYLSLLVLKTESYLFAAFTDAEKTLFLARFVVMYTMFPLVTVLLLKAVGFIQSVQLKTQRDRIIPYVACMIWYWWMWYVLHNQSQYPVNYVVLSLAIFLASIGGLLANIRMKVSMHAIAAGVMAGFVMLIGFSTDINFSVFVSCAILLAGLICTARLIVGGHSTKEIYTGLVIGIASLLIGFVFGK